MSIDMYVGSSQTQASTTLTKSKSDQQSYETMIKALQQFLGEDRLNSTAYTNAKSFYGTVLIPLVQAGTLLSEAVGTACQKFIDTYQSDVDSGDLKSDELEEKIRQMDTQLTNLENIRTTIKTSDLDDNIKMIQLTQNGIAKGTISVAKKTLEDKLEKLNNFESTSPTIFSAISELEGLVTKGASQANESWTGTGFSIPSDLSWTETVATKWQARLEDIEKKEREYHEAKVKELEEYKIYAWPYEDPVTKEVKVMWFIDKDGVRIFDEELQSYLEKYGKKLDGVYEVIGWDKVYELDLAARRRGDGKNYLNQNEIPGGGWQIYSAAGAYVETGYWYGKKTGLLDLAVAAGLSIHASKAGGTGTGNANKGYVSGEDWNNYFTEKYGAENVVWETNKLNTMWPSEINKLSLEEIRNGVPNDWEIHENNGRVHIKDEFATDRIRIDPPDKNTSYDHMHIYDSDKNPLDINGNIVN